MVKTGLIAGPLFLVGWAVQAFTREGFDPARHPASLLSLGALGWVQIANFVVTGLLFVACGIGMRSKLVALIGAGLVIAGVFPTDAGAGFPVGAPEGAPTMSWHGVVHELGFAVTTVSWIVLCISHRREMRGLCLGALAVVLVVVAWPDLNSLSLRLIVATAVQFGLVALLAVRYSGRSSSTRLSIP
ncbi:DUF998 domain-containing protein [Lentzea tibetensis]|uniref:DUF998 domain-containing protein n=1 Tax=Lentzea tibetensis TaxID=2591470 RepID=A0A563F330_9PSEU|nr:DUF998 domain-containing protein [Lentzea tibetensis]TWP54168.1 DUF998 domain-containing protein [Lentzea tibetensis]